MRARVVLAADGIGHSSLPESESFHSQVESNARVGIGGTTRDVPDGPPRGAVWMSVGRAGYVGQVQLADGELNIAAALDPEHLRRHGTSAAVAAIVREAGWPPPRSLEAIDWQGTIRLTRRTPRPAGPRLFVLGDAAGYVEPFTGEGITWAIASALAVVPLAERAVAAWNPGLEQAWLAHQRRLWSTQRTCRALAALLRRPAAVDGALGLLSLFPRLARPIVARLNSPAPLCPAAPP